MSESQWDESAMKAADGKIPPHIVITNPSKPWSTCAMDLECKDCGIALCKNCKPKHVCNEWVKSGYQAADEISDKDCAWDGYVPTEMMATVIAKHFADLRATYEKLVELAWAVRNHQANHGGLTTFCSWCDNIDVLLADPLVQSAIERSKKV